MTNTAADGLDTPERKHSKANGLARLLRPRSIAVFGASSDLTKVGGKVLRHALSHGFKGSIFPINPGKDVVQGLPAFKELAANYSPDVAIICLPAEQVPAALMQCVKASVGTAIVLSAGFAETGATGRALQQDLLSILDSGQTRLLGPNCLGVASVVNQAVLSFSSVFDGPLPPAGGLAVIAQSGALAASMLAMIRDEELKLGWWVTTGNEADITWLECAEVAVEEPGVAQVMIYAEAIHDGGRLLALGARAAVLGKHLIILRPGNSVKGQAAALSHTGSMATRSVLARGIVRQAGMVEVRDLPEMIDAHRVFLSARRWREGGVAAISTSGGAGIMLMDICAEYQLPIAELDSASARTLREVLPAFAATTNPVDVTGAAMYDINVMSRVFRAVAGDTDVGVIVLALTFITGDAAAILAKTIVQLASETSKPTLVIWLAGSMASAGYETLRASDVPLYKSVGAAGSALDALIRDRRNRERRSAADRAAATPAASRSKRGRSPGVVTETAAKELLSSYGIGVAEGLLTTCQEDAVVAARRLGYPLAVKSESEAFLHRAKLGGVLLGIRDEDELLAAHRAVVEAARAAGAATDFLRVRVEKMVGTRGLEFLVGGLSDPTIGSCIVIGLGGENSELLNDTVARRAPIEPGEVFEMISELGAGPGISSWLSKDGRGDGLADAVARLSRLISDLGPDLAEMDVNPLLVPAAGAPVALDALLVLQDAGAS